MSEYLSHADLGGQSVSGPINPDPEGELWHADWEPKAMALTLAMGATGAWNLDMSRAARETLPDYARRTYYEVWIGALEALLDERRLVTTDEITAGQSLHASPPLPKLLAKDVATTLSRGSPTERPATTAPLFAVGERVRTREGAVDHHTRLPRYVQGKLGLIESIHGMHVFADAHAAGIGERPQWLYTVAFDASDLWPDADPRVTVSVDAWEPYLQAYDR